MRDSDILLDFQASLPYVKREGMVITVPGFKFTLSVELSSITVGFKSFVVSDPDGFVVTDYNSELVKQWINENIMVSIPEDSKAVTSDHTFSVGLHDIQGKSHSKVIVKADSKEDAEKFGIERFGKGDGFNRFNTVKRLYDWHDADFDIRK